MIIGIGTDMVAMDRIAGVIQRQGQAFLQRCYTAAERAEGESLDHPDRRIAYFAKRFAAKEAVSKAFGCGIGAELTWQDIEITRDERGAPLAAVSAPIARGRHLHLSLSDEKGYALAFAVVEDARDD